MWWWSVRNDDGHDAMIFDFKIWLTTTHAWVPLARNESQSKATPDFVQRTY
jgi:hypothetical protein